jgi:hypothetical protein
MALLETCPRPASLCTTTTEAGYTLSMCGRWRSDVFSVGLGGEAEYFFNRARSTSVMLDLLYAPGIVTFERWRSICRLIAKSTITSMLGFDAASESMAERGAGCSSQLSIEARNTRRWQCP